MVCHHTQKNENEKPKRKNRPARLGNTGRGVIFVTWPKAEVGHLDSAMYDGARYADKT